MARVIVLDANVIIALFESSDVHHVSAVTLLDSHALQGFAASVLTVAEATVHPTRRGLQDQATRLLDDLGLEILTLDKEDAIELARIRGQYGLRMPDAVALHAAITTRSSLATFDMDLAAAARRAGVDVLG
jgi:predicted nucleic acid-binding protein